MGYCSRFEYIIKGKIENFNMNDAINQYFKEIHGEDFDPFVENCKWYDHVQDMINFSKLYPEILFIIKRTGEGEEDIEKLYYNNGKCVRVYAEITITFRNVPKSELDCNIDTEHDDNLFISAVPNTIKLSEYDDDDDDDSFSI